MKPTKHATTNYRRLMALIGSDSYRRYEAPEFMPLVLEKLYYNDRLGNPVYSIAHYGEQNGDAMRDPEITFSFDREHKTVEPLTYQQDYLGIYREVYQKRGDTWYCSQCQRYDTDEFLYGWLNNIEQQGYTLTRSKLL